MSWYILGPFQIGTREAVWGADPLELFGGFRALEYDPEATFKSSLAFNATTTWSRTSIEFPYPPPTQQATAELDVDFPDVEWDSLQDVYGWPALQWQAWARGTLNVRLQGAITLALQTEHVIEVWVDDQHYYGGDFYGYGKVATTLHLEPGSHRIDVRLIRDVRSEGTVGRPSLGVMLRVQALGPLLNAVKADTSNPHQGVLMPDIVGGDYGQFTSSYASVKLRNDGHEDATIVSLEATHNQCETELVSKDSIVVIPGQTRPLAFRVACISPITGRGATTILVKYTTPDSHITRTVYLSTWPLTRERHEAQKITFMHPGGMVSYAVLRPPSANAHCTPGMKKAPVMLVLHGAGLEADDEKVRKALDDLPDLCAWVLFPTGVTTWSSDDWHTWGLADVEAAIAAIPTWIENNEWEGVGVDTDRWLVTGHSNGGQGAWYIVTHRPDNVVAAAPLSGYSSIQNYVPYTMWRPSDPGKVAVIQGALLSYQHELLLENAKDIPILQQHGSEDDNVPVYHSRLLNWLLESAAGVASDYHEMPGRPHWWSGVFVTEPLKHFLRSNLNTGGPEIEGESIPINRRDFAVVSAGNGDMGSKNGVKILQLKAPGRLGKVHITHDPLTQACVFEVSNVAVFHLPAQFAECSLYVNSQEVPLEIVTQSDESAELTLAYENGTWTQTTADGFPLPPRQGRQQGTIDSLLRTRGAFQIVHASPTARKIALQVSRNLCQYFGADTIISSDHSHATTSTTANIITIALGQELPKDESSLDLPISVENNRIQIRDITNGLQAYPMTPDLGAIWLRPLPDERLELVIWGAEEKGLEIAARLAPLVTGSGVPDFVIVNHKMLFQGLEGVLALGYFDGWWNVSRNSYFT
ncbi:hypothetical protein LTR78_007222 [Recurvomyces mirabilis]|uniref:Peptidase S9 prolyl oligopeptidase catalytic domain-containing protein n=1 Tax=Recurvomyces mirabilis TaxID=574656 RepID=A0AAE0WJI3_9PEZI|nr:hypothetical protein LTR78_007222 [Recurvomyces mirabilis]